MVDTTKPLSPRRGIAVTITLDHEAAAILDTLAPSRKTMGKTVSRLLHSEMVRREERDKVYREAAQARVDKLKTKQGTGSKHVERAHA